jgi:ATP-dependent Clp protease ATP-binding subunit ClpA
LGVSIDERAGGWEDGGMGLRAWSPVLIGRTRELDRLLQVMGVASAQGLAVALVAGEAGVGKTRLVHELTARAA